MFPIQDHLHYWLAAIRLPNIGPVKIRRWLTSFSNLKNLFNASLSDWQAAAISANEINALQNPDWKAVEKDFAWLQKSNHHIVTQDDNAYPILLKELYDSPLLLFVQGAPDTLAQPQLAIVGSRNPTVTGRETAEQFAFCLAQAGLTITSGLALGIDAASHHGALAAAKTIAVTGCGLNFIYPATHRALAEKIIGNGALVSEFPPDIPPAAKNFPRRNRIISGLSLGVLVVEAALKSGSLITARCAADQNREVFAIPGSIHNPLARGCHQLIQQGAKLVEKSEDILIELGALYTASKPIIDQNNGINSVCLDQKQASILSQIGYEATALNTIIMRSGLTASEVSSMLLVLELHGYVQTVSGGYTLSSKASEVQETAIH
jgi:DNA processing protein